MTTHQYNFGVWCENAVSGILFPPDQSRVYHELLDHLYDHYDDLIDQGCDPDTAARLTLAAMGDARAIAPQLAAIHRPFWGYFLRATRVLLVLALCAALISGGIRLWRTEYSDLPKYRIDPFRDTHVELDTSTYTRVFYAEPGLSAQSDGYTITLTNAALWHADHNDSISEDSNNFYFRMEVFNPRPWAEHRDMIHWFSAVDSLGNTYDCYYDGIVNYAPYISGNAYRTAPLTCTYEMFINDYRSEEAEWIEFRYDRSGRHLAFRLDLTGGAAA